MYINKIFIHLDGKDGLNLMLTSKTFKKYVEQCPLLKIRVEKHIVHLNSVYNLPVPKIEDYQVVNETRLLEEGNYYGKEDLIEFIHKDRSVVCSYTNFYSDRNPYEKETWNNIIDN